MEKYLNKILISYSMKIQKITEVIGLKVYTDGGEFFGEIEGANLHENKVDGWRVRAGGSVISLLGGARGVIIPHHFVKSIGDVFIINKAALPSPSESHFEEDLEEIE